MSMQQRIEAALGALQPAAVHVAFIEHAQVHGLQGGKRRFNTLLHVHSGSAYFFLAGAAFGSSSAVMSASSLLTTGTALSSLAWVICADCWVN